MEKSDHYYQRKLRMRNLIVPTISETRKELGNELAGALFHQCPDPLKPYMGLAPLLKGAGDDLWVSPSDILIGKVCLKPPLTSKHIKALTHQGILMIGRDVEIKFWNDAELTKKRALAEQEEMLVFMAELEKRKAVLAARRDEQKKCEEEKANMKVAFERELQNELSRLDKTLKKTYDELMRVQKIKLEKAWKEKLEDAVAETTARLTNQFLKDLADQEKELLKKFLIEMKKEDIKRKMEVKEAEECCRETFLYLKHQLQCKNIANIMYVLCTERRKCQAELEQIQKDFQKEMQHLHDLITEKDVEISRLTEERDEKVKQLNLKEECVLEIIRQFQKFINFTLRSYPTQAEFLLSVEKMMLYELTQAIAKADKKRARRLAEMLLPLKAECKTASSTLSVKQSLTSLIADDHHQCYNEIEKPADVVTSSEYLPAFHYNKHMYVREDFRNMMSQGIEISPSNLIWNHDVEHLMHVLKRSTTSLNEQKRKEEEEKEMLRKEKEEEERKAKEEAEKDVQKVKENPVETTENADSILEEEYLPRSPKQEFSRKSIVCFKQSDGADLLFPIFESYSSLTTDPTEIFNEITPEQTPSDDLDAFLMKECCEPCRLAYTHKSEVRSKESPLPLIGTKNSLELRKESLKMAPHHPEQESLEQMGILGARDSLYKHRMSLRPTNKMRDSLPKVIELRKKSQNSIKDANGVHKNAAFPSQSSLLKKHFRLENQTSTKRVLQDSKAHQAKTETEISRLSLTRDSYLVHKQSLIMKRCSKQASDIIKSERTESLETIKLKKPRLPDQLEKTFLKKPSKLKASISENQSTRLSIIPSTESIKRIGIPTSKLTMSRDSLELIRSHSKISSASKRKNDSKDSIEIKSEMLGSHLQGEQLYPPIIKLEDDGSRTVKMSHIEILPFEDRIVDDAINGATYLDEEDSNRIDSVYDTKDITKDDSPWLIYQKEDESGKEEKSSKESRENFLKKPNVAYIGGDRHATEHLQKDKEFTLHRAASLMSIFKKHPSLIKIFTPCAK